MALAVVAMAAATFYLLPYVTVFRIIAYLDEGDRVALEGLIDFPRLRTALKEQMTAELQRSGVHPPAGTMAELVIHQLITPEGLVTQAARYREAQGVMGSKGYLTGTWGIFGTLLRHSEYRYRSPREFVVSLGTGPERVVSFTLERDAWRWRLTSMAIDQR
ncbi:MAG: DUF2939 domain-containing protein [Syntrophales bacterium]|nr:DUF2939 domain-containing protein [Syntrophales bacterium]